MHLSVQLAAHRLGVSPHTIRRWTDSGLLPCVRTAGGHRRIRSEDIDELATLVDCDEHLTARLAREREVESLAEASIALTSRLELPELLEEIARRTTAILGCHFCTVSDYDADTDVVCVLADFDRNGRRFADWQPYLLKEYPFSKRLMATQELAVVRVSDPAADPAETAVMRRWDEKTMLLIPLVYGQRSVGLLEVYDHERERRFTRQELRLARALAGLAAVALHNARVFTRVAQGDAEARVLAGAVDAAIEGLPALAGCASLEQALRATAALARRALDASAVSAAWPDAPVVTAGGEDATRAGAGPDAVAASGGLTLSVALPQPGGEQEQRALRLIAAAAAPIIAAYGRDADASAATASNATAAGPAATAAAPGTKSAAPPTT